MLVGHVRSPLGLTRWRAGRNLRYLRFGQGPKTQVLQSPAVVETVEKCRSDSIAAVGNTAQRLGEWRCVPPEGVLDLRSITFRLRDTCDIEKLGCCEWDFPP